MKSGRWLQAQDQTKTVLDVLQELAVAGVVGVRRLGQLDPHEDQAIRGQPHLHGEMNALRPRSSGRGALTSRPPWLLLLDDVFCQRSAQNHARVA